jgi:transposase InsO family protein
VEKKKKEKVALFRFGIIAPLVGLKNIPRGEKENFARDIISQQWDIPFSERSYISRSTIFSWLKRYEESGGKLESLYPIQRRDRGNSRTLTEETELTLLNLKKELKGASLPVILRVGRERKILPADFKVSGPTIYRLFKHHGLDKAEHPKKDLRRFEAEFSNDLWQSDCMHGPKVVLEGKLKKSFLFSFLDDHSRLITHSQFYLQENLQNFLNCLNQALSKRGLPRKLYVDNGPCFRSHHLAYTTASLGIALIHCKPYRPEGKGKIERWHKTLRMQFLPTLSAHITLEDLNERLTEWVNKQYHLTSHSSTKETPLSRYQNHLKLIKPAPKNLNDYFRNRLIRKVDKDRTISALGRVYEAPISLVGKKITLLYHHSDPDKMEVSFDNKSYGFLTRLNPHINSKIIRDKSAQLVEKNTNTKKTFKNNLVSGKLFERKIDK